MTTTTLLPTTTPVTTEPTPGTCTAEEFVEAFMVTELVPMPGGYFTERNGVHGACALGARIVQLTGLDVPQLMAQTDKQAHELADLHRRFMMGVGDGFDSRCPVIDGNDLYDQGYAVGQQVRQLMGVTE